MHILPFDLIRGVHFHSMQAVFFGIFLHKKLIGVDEGG